MLESSASSMVERRRKYAAEAVGTFALVFVGAGAVVVDGHTGTSHGTAPSGMLGLIGVALAHGLTLGAMVLAAGGISGGHFNPAVSMAAWIRRRLDGDLLLGYLLAQLGGALVASLVLAGVFPDEITLAGLGTPSLAARISLAKGMFIEATITFLLVIVILYATRDDNQDRSFAGLAIGGTLAALILFAGPLTGAGANPARYLGPALVSGNLAQLLAYVVGPLLGAAAAAYMYGAAELLLEPAAKPSGDTGDDQDGDGWAASSERRHEPEGEPGSAPLRLEPDDVLEHARVLFWRGETEQAAAEVDALLNRRHELGPHAAASLRSLMLMLEDERAVVPHPQ